MRLLMAGPFVVLLLDHVAAAFNLKRDLRLERRLRLIQRSVSDSIGANRCPQVEREPFDQLLAPRVVNPLPSPIVGIDLAFVTAMHLRS
jgi:hypothetical protein